MKAFARPSKRRLQMLFDRVSTHLLTQKKRSMKRLSLRTSPSCAYRGTGGTSCAVGCLIDDANYCKKLEGENINKIAVSEAVGKSVGFQLSGPERNLLYAFQCIHDDRHPRDWAGRFKALADSYNLTFKKPA